MPTTENPRSNKYAERCDPMKPAAPVTRALKQRASDSLASERLGGEAHAAGGCCRSSVPPRIS